MLRRYERRRGWIISSCSGGGDGRLESRANRRIPPLRYDEVYALCDDFTKCDFTLNGGVDSIARAKELLDREDGKLAGVMMVEPFTTSLSLADVDRVIFGVDVDASAPPLTRRSIVKTYGEFGDRALAEELAHADAAIYVRKRKAVAENYSRRRRVRTAPPPARECSIAPVTSCSPHDTTHYRSIPRTIARSASISWSVASTPSPPRPRRAARRRQPRGREHTRARPRTRRRRGGGRRRCGQGEHRVFIVTDVDR